MYTGQNVMLLVSYNLMFHVFLQYLCYYSNDSEKYLNIKTKTQCIFRKGFEKRTFSKKFIFTKSSFHKSGITTRLHLTVHHNYKNNI